MIPRSKESDIQRSILNYLRTHYPTAVTWKLHEDQVFGVVGIPDILFITEGMTFFFEVKKPGEKPSRIQEVVLHKLQRNDIIADVVYGVQDVQRLLIQGGINACI